MVLVEGPTVVAALTLWFIEVKLTNPKLVVPTPIPAPNSVWKIFISISSL